MAITLIRLKNSYCPVAICDVCGQPIEDATAGYVVWDEGRELQLIHRIGCDDHTRMMSMSLNDFLFDLLFNLKYDVVEAGKHKEMLDETLG